MIKETKYTILLLYILVSVSGCKDSSKKIIPKEADIEKKGEMENETLELLVGTFTNGESEGIYKLDFDPKTGEIDNKILLVEKENPGYLDLSEDRSIVYSSNSGKPGSVSAYKFTEDRSKLNLIGDYSSLGNGACHIEINDKENLLAAANYGSGNIVVYPLDGNGGIIDSAQSFKHIGNGPHPNQKSPHAHCVKFDSSGKYLYAVDLGIDEIVSYEIGDDIKISNQRTALKTDPGDGPRHMIFHPNKDMTFIVNELSSSVISVSLDSVTGSLTIIDKQSTLPSNFDGANACADIHFSKDGKFLYVSNRGHNSIAIFSVSDEGKLQLLGTEAVQGDWPRNFTLSPSGKFLLVANQNSNNVTVFRVEKESGLLSFTGNQMEISQPVCLKF